MATSEHTAGGRVGADYARRRGDRLGYTCACWLLVLFLHSAHAHCWKIPSCVLYCATLSSISSRSKFESDDEWKHDTLGCAGRTQQVWDVLFKTVAAEDPSSHLTSLHNDKYLYNLSQPWLTHYSIQHVHNRPADLWRIFGRKPFVWDEVKYEGDVPKNWGSLRPGQMVDKFWWGAACGAYSGTL